MTTPAAPTCKFCGGEHELFDWAGEMCIRALAIRLTEAETLLRGYNAVDKALAERVGKLESVVQQMGPPYAKQAVSPYKVGPCCEGVIRQEDAGGGLRYWMCPEHGATWPRETLERTGYVPAPEPAELARKLAPGWIRLAKPGYNDGKEGGGRRGEWICTQWGDGGGHPQALAVYENTPESEASCEACAELAGVFTQPPTAEPARCEPADGPDLCCDPASESTPDVVVPNDGKMHTFEAEGGPHGEKWTIDGEVVKATGTYAESTPDVPGAINQCDGCRRGQPIVNGLHRTPGSDITLGDSMMCTADRYRTTGVPKNGTGQYAAEDIALDREIFENVTSTSARPIPPRPEGQGTVTHALAKMTINRMSSSSSEWKNDIARLRQYTKANEAREQAQADEIGKLSRDVAELRRQLTFQSANNHKRNVELDALRYVWCNGGCKGGVHRFEAGAVTEEVVAAAEHNAQRLRTWFANKAAKDARNMGPPCPPTTELAALKQPVPVGVDGAENGPRALNLVNIIRNRANCGRSEDSVRAELAFEVGMALAAMAAEAEQRGRASRDGVAEAGMGGAAVDDGWEWQVETYYTPWCKFEENGKECGVHFLAGNNGPPVQSQVKKYAEGVGWKDGRCPKHALASLGGGR